MQTRRVTGTLALLLLFITLTSGLCTKEETVDPPPPPPDYIPAFSPTAAPVTIAGVEMLDFYITCTTDNWEMISVKITSPGGVGDATYSGNGSIVLQSETFTFPDFFPKLLGTWSFQITGNVKSGTHVGESFVATCSVSVTGK